MRPTILLLLAMCAVGAVGAEEIRTGRYSVTFSERSPWSAWRELSTRFSWGTPDHAPAENVYDLADEPFDVYVPASYDGSEAYGLIAYVSWVNGGSADTYASVCDERKLIWVAATKVPNERAGAIRVGLTLDGVHNIQARYRIDPDRVYTSGLSGGGRVSSLLGVTFADVFTGAIYLCGCNAPKMPASKDALARVMAVLPERRFAFMTGSKDFNRDDTKLTLESYKASKIAHLGYFETPDLAHNPPPVDWYSRAVAFCDQPLVERAAASLAQGEALIPKGKLRDAHAALVAAGACVPAVEVRGKAAAKLAEIAPSLEQDLAKELDKLIAQKGSAEKLRAFAEAWRTFASGTRARTQAESIATAELDALLANGKPPASPLRAFVAAWTGYAARDRAVDALDGLARDAYAAVTALPPGERRLKALAKFASEWAPTPTAAAAKEALTSGLEAQLTALLAIDKPLERGRKLQAFVAAWPGTRVAEQAQAKLTELAAGLAK